MQRFFGGEAQVLLRKNEKHVDLAHGVLSCLGMKTIAHDKIEARKLAKRLARKFNKAYVYITLVNSGQYRGQYVVTPDRMHAFSELFIEVPEGAAVLPGTDGLLVKSGSTL